MAGDIGTFILLTISTVSLICMLTFNALAGSGKGGVLFVCSVSEASDTYPTFITPAGWAFIIWTLIFLWLALGQVFFIISFFLKNDGKRIVHESASTTFLIVVSINFLLNTSWIFITDRACDKVLLLGVGFGVLFAIVVTNIIACLILAENIKRSKSSMVYKIINRIILNGYCLYTTWTAIASLINALQAVIYISKTAFEDIDEPWDDEAYSYWMNCGAYTALTLLVAAHVTYFIFENFVFEKSLRWVLTPYLVVIWASSAVYDKRHEDIRIDDTLIVSKLPKGIVDFTLAIIIIACITFVVRIALVAFRSLKK